ncbi:MULTISPECIES: low molecular weight protein-tyrosine-phosphatase [unclassified Burkholderia]|uniref:low molecular weight protein-tyrosine-phosphatase n=1 Tax=unclassified Burkholderia TaxID=2613784 RepID=UPI0005CDDE38|nr:MULTISPECIES: low molecular weight protein-tyrosine-phosphatase [unclassified Burkholderia]TGN94708.1 low molecular weight phosphotyrosine protein phosphatase [Burkholderia sp. USMB20]
MNSILVLCEGNVCRSPMAGAILQDKLPQIVVHTAGIRPMIGQPADPVAVGLMAERNLDISLHRAKLLNREKVVAAAVIFVMERWQEQVVLNSFPLARGKVFCLGRDQSSDIPDPYKLGLDAFVKSLSLIDAGVDKWLGPLTHLFKRAQ